MKWIITILMAMFISMGSASAQEVAVSVENNDVIGKAYIYCKVSFDDTKVEREEKDSQLYTHSQRACIYPEG